MNEKQTQTGGCQGKGDKGGKEGRNGSLGLAKANYHVPYG